MKSIFKKDVSPLERFKTSAMVNFCTDWKSKNLSRDFTNLVGIKNKILNFLPKQFLNNVQYVKYISDAFEDIYGNQLTFEQPDIAEFMWTKTEIFSNMKP